MARRARWVAPNPHVGLVTRCRAVDRARLSECSLNGRCKTWKTAVSSAGCRYTASKTVPLLTKSARRRTPSTWETSAPALSPSRAKIASKARRNSASQSGAITSSKMVKPLVSSALYCAGVSGWGTNPRCNSSRSKADVPGLSCRLVARIRRWWSRLGECALRRRRWRCARGRSTSGRRCCPEPRPRAFL